MPFKQQSGLVNIPLKQWPYICKKYNPNQLQTKDITLILILGMGITRRKPVALTRNMVTLWRRRTSAPTLPPPTPCPARARCSLFKYQPLDIQCTVLGISHKYWLLATLCRTCSRLIIYIYLHFTHVFQSFKRKLSKGSRRRSLLELKSVLSHLRHDKQT